MIIHAKKIYRINYQEDTDCNTGSSFVMNSDPHNPPYLEFYGYELENAIIVMGMLPEELTKSSKLKRSEEIKYKIHIIQTALKETYDNKGHYDLSMDENALAFLDSSEKGYISYLLGMVFATLVAQKTYNYKYIVHYSKFEKSKYCRYPIPKTPYLNPKTGKHVLLSSPDLVGMNIKGRKYGVFEAKGYQYFYQGVMRKAVNQVQQIKSINGKPVDRIVAYSRLLSSGNTIRTKDPTEGFYNIELDDLAALIWQYLPVVELLNELQSNKNYKTSDNFQVFDASFIEGSKHIKIHSDTFNLINDFLEVNSWDEKYNKRLSNVNAGAFKLYIE